MAQLERDAALGRVSRTRRWMIVGAAALSAGFAALVSAIAPGHSLGKARRVADTIPAPARVPASTAGSQQMPPLASPSALGLQGPSSNPQSSSDPSQQSVDPSQQQSVDPSQQQSVDPSQQQVDPSQAAQPVAPSPPVVSGGS